MRFFFSALLALGCTPDPLVPGDTGIIDARPEPFLDEGVAVADAAGLHPHADLAMLRFGNLALHEFEGASGHAYLRCSHRWHDILPQFAVLLDPVDTAAN